MSFIDTLRPSLGPRAFPPLPHSPLRCSPFLSLVNAVSLGGLVLASSLRNFSPRGRPCPLLTLAFPMQSICPTVPPLPLSTGGGGIRFLAPPGVQGSSGCALHPALEYLNIPSLWKAGLLSKLRSCEDTGHPIPKSKH